MYSWTKFTISCILLYHGVLINVMRHQWHKMVHRTPLIYSFIDIIILWGKCIWHLYVKILCEPNYIINECSLCYSFSMGSSILLRLFDGKVDLLYSESYLLYTVVDYCVKWRFYEGLLVFPCKPVYVEFLHKFKERTFFRQ